MVEHMFEKEIEEHLGYEKHAVAGKNSGNSRNGKNTKTVQSSHGLVEIDVPRDRNGEFSPQLVKKRQRNISSFDDKIISMYAKGMSARDIQAHVQEIYGADISATMISHITGKVVDAAHDWQARPLERVYPITYFDAIHYKVREDGRVVSKAAYSCLGIDWIGESEGAKF
jgi:transposase-like protein